MVYINSQPIATKICNALNLEKKLQENDHEMGRKGCLHQSEGGYMDCLGQAGDLFYKMTRINHS